MATRFKDVMLGRRTVLLAAPALLAWPAAARDVTEALRFYEHVSGGRVGVYAENLHNGARLAWRADTRFVMCSTFKASLAACVLARVDRGEDDLADVIRFGPADVGDMWAPFAKENLAKGALTVGEMCQAAVELSDNTCANLLLARIGGPPAMTAFWRSIGDDVSRLDHNEPMLNRSPPGDPHDTTTPRAMAGNLRRLVVGDVLSPGSRALFKGWLIGCQTGADRLPGGLPRNWVIGDKTGNNGKDAAGDIAVAWPRPGEAMVMAAYTQAGAPSEAQLAAVFAAVGRLVGMMV